MKPYKKYKYCLTCGEKYDFPYKEKNHDECYEIYKMGFMYYKCNRCNKEYKEPKPFGLCYVCKEELLEE